MMAADDFSGFDARYDISRYDTIGTKAPDTSINASWLNANPDKTLKEFEPYKSADFDSKGRIVRFNTELYKRVFETDKGDVVYTKKPAKIVIKHYARKWWKPTTWKKTLHVHAVMGYATKTFESGKANDFVSTIGFNDKLMSAIKHRTNEATGKVNLCITSKGTPVMYFVLAKTPSDELNLSIVFLYISTLIAILFSLIGEGWHWSENFRYFVEHSPALISGWVNYIKALI